MKKITLLAIATLAMLFSACEDDKDTLEGTQWTSIQSDSEVVTLTFHKTTVDSKYTLDEDMDGTIDDEDGDTGKYTYDDPNVVIFDGSGETITGIVSGQKMTFGFGEDQIVFFRK